MSGLRGGGGSKSHGRVSKMDCDCANVGHCMRYILQFGELDYTNINTVHVHDTV